MCYVLCVMCDVCDIIQHHVGCHHVAAARDHPRVLPSAPARVHVHGFLRLGQLHSGRLCGSVLPRRVADHPQSGLWGVTVVWDLVCVGRVCSRVCSVLCAECEVCVV